MYKRQHINYAFATIEDGRVVAKVLDRNLGKIHLLKEIKAQNPHLKTLISIGGWGAVSYTHLDVYKRQDNYRLLRKIHGYKLAIIIKCRHGFLSQEVILGSRKYFVGSIF